MSKKNKLGKLLKANSKIYKHRLHTDPFKSSDHTNDLNKKIEISENEFLEFSSMELNFTMTTSEIEKETKLTGNKTTDATRVVKVLTGADALVLHQKGLMHGAVCNAASGLDNLEFMHWQRGVEVKGKNDLRDLHEKMIGQWPSDKTQGPRIRMGDMTLAWAQTANCQGKGIIDPILDDMKVEIYNNIAKKPMLVTKYKESKTTPHEFNTDNDSVQKIKIMNQVFPSLYKNGYLMPHDDCLQGVRTFFEKKKNSDRMQITLGTGINDITTVLTAAPAFGYAKNDQGFTKDKSNDDVKGITQSILEPQFNALADIALKKTEGGKRVPLLLTPTGIGIFGNDENTVYDCIKSAIKKIHNDPRGEKVDIYISSYRENEADASYSYFNKNLSDISVEKIDKTTSSDMLNGTHEDQIVNGRSNVFDATCKIALSKAMNLIPGSEDYNNFLNKDMKSAVEDINLLDNHHALIDAIGTLSKTAKQGGVTNELAHLTTDIDKMKPSDLNEATIRHALNSKNKSSFTTLVLMAFSSKYNDGTFKQNLEEYKSNKPGLIKSGFVGTVLQQVTTGSINAKECFLQQLKKKNKLRIATLLRSGVLRPGQYSYEDKITYLAALKKIEDLKNKKVHDHKNEDENRQDGDHASSPGANK